MTPPDRPRALAAARQLAEELGLEADRLEVLHASNTLTVLLQPCAVVARIGSGPQEAARFEVGIADQLARTGAPVVPVLPRDEPQVHRRGDLVISLWAYREPVSAQAVPPVEYADALHRLHAGMRLVTHATPHASDRVDAALGLLADPARTPDLAPADRQLLVHTLRALRPGIVGTAAEQILHGEPHPGNVLATATGPEFLDFETCCRGPVEFDIAHAPSAVAQHYPGADAELVARCRRLVLAMVTTWRFDRGDEFPDGRRLGAQWLEDLRRGRDPFAG